MKTIWKYEINPISELDIPEGAEVLTVQMQGDSPQLWALVNPDAPKVRRVFRVYGTGHQLLDQTGRYIATFQMHSGGLVFHVFED